MQIKYIDYKDNTLTFELVSISEKFKLIWSLLYDLSELKNSLDFQFIGNSENFLFQLTDNDYKSAKIKARNYMRLLSYEFQIMIDKYACVH